MNAEMGIPRSARALHSFRIRSCFAKKSWYCIVTGHHVEILPCLHIVRVCRHHGWFCGHIFVRPQLWVENRSRKGAGGAGQTCRHQRQTRTLAIYIWAHQFILWVDVAYSFRCHRCDEIWPQETHSFGWRCGHRWIRLREQSLHRFIPGIQACFCPFLGCQTTRHKIERFHAWCGLQDDENCCPIGEFHGNASLDRSRVVELL